MSDKENLDQEGFPPEISPKINFFHVLVKKGLIINVIITAVILIFYLTVPGLSDEALFLLLWMLRFLSIFIFIFSLYSFIISIRFLTKKPSVKKALVVFLYFLCIIIGIGLVFFNAFIVVFATGNQ